jgi:hypothetical protein
MDILNPKVFAKALNTGPATKSYCSIENIQENLRIYKAVDGVFVFLFLHRNKFPQNMFPKCKPA